MQGVDCVLDGNRLWFGEVDQKHHVFLARVSELPVDNLNVLMCANQQIRAGLFLDLHDFLFIFRGDMRKRNINLLA